MTTLQPLSQALKSKANLRILQQAMQETKDAFRPEFRKQTVLTLAFEDMARHLTDQINSRRATKPDRGNPNEEERKTLEVIKETENLLSLLNTLEPTTWLLHDLFKEHRPYYQEAYQYQLQETEKTVMVAV